MGGRLHGKVILHALIEGDIRLLFVLADVELLKGSIVVFTRFDAEEIVGLSR